VLSSSTFRIYLIQYPLESSGIGNIISRNSSNELSKITPIKHYAKGSIPREPSSGAGPIAVVLDFLQSTAPSDTFAGSNCLPCRSSPGFGSCGSRPPSRQIKGIQAVVARLPWVFCAKCLKSTNARAGGTKPNRWASGTGPCENAKIVELLMLRAPTDYLIVLSLLLVII